MNTEYMGQPKPYIAPNKNIAIFEMSDVELKYLKDGHDNKTLSLMEEKLFSKVYSMHDGYLNEKATVDVESDGDRRFRESVEEQRREPK